MGSNVAVAKPMAPQPSPPGRKPSFRRAFLPFWVALVFGILIMARDYHARHSILTRLAVKVTVDGKEPEQGFSVTVNGARQSLNSPLPMGSVEIGIHAPDSEPKSQSRFVWYGVTDLGSVNLLGSRGSLEAKVVPTPDIYELAGKRGSWTNTTGSFLDLPVGRYELVSRFGSLIERTRVEVERNRTSRVDVAAKIGSLELSSDPPEGAFELMSPATESFVGAFPAKYTRLLEGEYRLVAKRPGYERKLELRVRRNETNRVVVKFVYGSAQITTTPAGATVFWAGKEQGKTPMAWTNRMPGTYQIGIELDGHDTRFVEVKVDDEATAKVDVTLVNTRYREAMEGARVNLENNRFERAAQFLDAALLAQPGDAAAAKLLPETRARGARARAEELAQRGEFDAALSALDSALKAFPGEPLTMALQQRIRSSKTQTSEKREARFQQLMAEARSMASWQDFNGALTLLDEAKQILPNEAEITLLEASLRKDQTKLVAELARKRSQDGLEARRNESNTAFELALRSEKDARSSPASIYKTSKSATEVRTALERLGKRDASFKIRELNPSSPDMFTAKLGEISPGATVGQYFRIGVTTYEEGNTQVLVKLIAYTGGSSETNVVLLQKHLERFRTTLAPLLSNDFE